MTLRSTRFEGNAAQRGGAIHAVFPVGASQPELVLDNVALAFNVANDGGAGVLDGNVSMEGVEIVDNEACEGGGLYIEGGETTIDMDSSVKRNDASFRSGRRSRRGLGLLRLESADFGAGIDDNTPQDLQSDDGSTDAVLGTVANATCTQAGCSAP